MKLTTEHSEKAAMLIAECFIDDPLTRIQLEGLDREFYEKLLLLQFPYFVKTVDGVSLDDNIKSVIFSYEKRNKKPLKQGLLSIVLLIKMIRQLNFKQFKIFLNNSKKISKELNLKWQKEFIKDNYYHIQIIAISKEERGKGNFRALISPIIDYCNENNLPITLECTNPANIPIYEHYGFELVKTITTSLDIEQYCFIKYPI